MTNPKAQARTEIVQALTGMTVPVHMYPPQAVGGPCIVLTQARETVRGHIVVAMRAVVPDATSLPVLEQLEADARDLIVAAGGIGWAETVPQATDPTTGYVYTEIELTTR